MIRFSPLFKVLLHPLLWKGPQGVFGFDGNSALLINNKYSAIRLYIKNFYI